MTADASPNGGGGALGLILAAIVAPIAAMLLQMAVSRSREYHADATAAQITREPRALASALQRLHEAARQMLYGEIHRLFVEYEGALVGVISQTDIVGAVAGAKL